MASCVWLPRTRSIRRGINIESCESSSERPASSKPGGPRAGASVSGCGAGTNGAKNQPHSLPGTSGCWGHTLQHFVRSFPTHTTSCVTQVGGTKPIYGRGDSGLGTGELHVCSIPASPPHHCCFVGPSVAQATEACGGTSCLLLSVWAVREGGDLSPNTC